MFERPLPSSGSEVELGEPPEMENAIGITECDPALVRLIKMPPGPVESVERKEDNSVQEARAVAEWQKLRESLLELNGVVDRIE
jgi:hypothetical protein